MRRSSAWFAVVIVAGAALVAELAAQPAMEESIQAALDRKDRTLALEKARASLAAAEASHGADSLQAADALESIVRIASGGRIGDPSGWGADARRALSIRTALQKESDPALAFSCYVVGLALYLGGNAAEALPYFDTALRKAESAYGSQSAELEWYVREYGAALFAEGRFREALAAFQRLDRISRAKYGAGHAGTVPALFNLALAHDVLGDLESAEPLYLSALAILERGAPPDIEKLTWTLDAYSGLLAREGRLGEALAQCERAIDLRRRHLGAESPELAQSLVGHGKMLFLVGDYVKSRTQLLASIDVQRRSAPTKVLYSAYLNLATVYRLDGNLEGARVALEDARRTATAVLPERHELWFGLHAENGEVLASLGDLDGARAAVGRALEIGRATMGEFHYDYGATLASLGRLELLDGRAAAAREHLERALGILAVLGKQEPLYIEAEESLGLANYASNLAASAFTLGIEAESARRGLDRATLAVLPERQALAQAGRRRRGRDLVVSMALAPDAPAERKSAAFDAVIRSRAVVFDEMAARRRLFSADASVKTKALVGRLREAKSRMAGLFVQGPGSDPSGFSTRVTVARATVEAAETELARESAADRARFQSREFGASDLRRALPAGSACLSYLRYQRALANGTDSVRSYAAIVQRGGAASPLVFDLGDADGIENAVAEWRATLQASAATGPGGEREYRGPAARLRARIWDPIAGDLTGIETLFVVPDGSLQLVSLAALPVAPDAYLLERGPAFQYLTAERDLAGRGADSKSRSSGLLALGNPAFDDGDALAASNDPIRGQTPTCAGFEAVRFGALPGAAAEVETVRSVWKQRTSGGEARVLVGTAATEFEFKRDAPRRQVLHLATHGFFLEEDCGSAGPYRGIGAVSPTRKAPGASADDSIASPLLLSGLALAGANRRGSARAGVEDGILTAEEVSALDLTGVRLAVLSACRTGAGRVTQGEGVFGLRRAFLVAGAATVITNLWEVEDRAALAWIDAFYNERFSRAAKIPEAVRRASLAVLAARRTKRLSTHPFYWGGWLAFGKAD